MCDAGPEGGEERRARRDRHLAGRTGLLNDDVLRVAAAVGTDAFGFAIWNLTARSPLRLARDLASGSRRPPTLLRGIVHFALGLGLLTAGGLLVLPLVGRARDFIAVETIALIAALIVEQLVGADVRRLYAGGDRA